ncbi:MAG: hypothetical protein ACWA5U_12005 [bacterium]
MLDSKRQGILSVSLLDMSAHNRAILEFFFNGAGKQTFKLTSKDHADIFITDFDQPNAREHWHDQYAQLGRPAIILAYKETHVEHTIWLSKPLSSLAVLKASEQIRQMLSGDYRTQTQNTNTTAQVEQNYRSTVGTANDTHDDAPQQSTLRSSLSPSLRAKQGVLNNPLKHKFVPSKTAAKKAAAHTFKAPQHTETRLVTETNVSNQQDDVQAQQQAAQAEVDKKAQAARWQLLCGEYADVQNLSNWQQECVHYAPENYFIASLKDALRLATQSQQMVEVKTTEQHMLILPDMSQIYFSIPLTEQAFVTFCNSPVRKNQIQIHILNTNEAELARHKISQSSRLLNDLEAFVWSCQLLTAQGRLARGTDITRPALLKYWPNMTRIESIPHMMDIAALWSDSSASIVELAKRLDIPQRYVISFYHAAALLGLMEQDNSKLKSKTRTESNTKKNRGLFSRLLKRLIGN